MARCRSVAAKKWDNCAGRLDDAATIRSNLDGSITFRAPESKQHGFFFLIFFYNRFGKKFEQRDFFTHPTSVKSPVKTSHHTKQLKGSLMQHFYEASQI